VAARAIIATSTTIVLLTPVATVAQQRPATRAPAAPAAPLAAAPAAPTAAPPAAPNVATPAAAATLAGPQKLDVASPAWTVTCVSHARAVAADCAVEQRLFAKESGRLLSVAVVSVPGATHQPVLIFQLPTGLSLQEGVWVAIDDAPGRPLALQSCDGRGCFVSLPLLPDLLRAMQAGQVMTVRAVSAAHESLLFPHMLTDFAPAFEAAR
jgi:invasion protein IalB